MSFHRVPYRWFEFNPNSATSHEKYAFFLVRTGNSQQALSEIERSVDLDPVSGSPWVSLRERYTIAFAFCSWRTYSPGPNSPYFRRTIFNWRDVR